MIPGQVMNFNLVLTDSNSVRSSFVLFIALGLAPNLIAFFNISLPSVPFNPTEPPIPEMGFMIKPNLNLVRFFIYHQYN